MLVAMSPTGEQSTMSLWNSFLIAFTVLLPLINPLGSALVFLGLVGDAPPDVFRALARRIAINNVIFLAVIEVLGATILKFFRDFSSHRPTLGRHRHSRHGLEGIE